MKKYCKWCGKEFMLLFGNRRFCSPAHRQEAYRQRRNEKQKEYDKRYRNKPGTRKRMREYLREYYRSPEKREKRKEYRQTQKKRFDKIYADALAYQMLAKLTQQGEQT